MLSFLRKIISDIINFLYIPFQRFIPAETFRYAATGGLNLALDIFLYFIFYNFVLQKQNLDLHIVVISPHIAAFLIVFPITFLSGFVLAKYITFTSSVLAGKHQLMRYAVSVGGSIFLNYLLLKLFVEIMNIYPTPAKMITAVFVVTYSYLTQKLYTFK